MAESKNNPFEILFNVNVNEHTETKDTGKYKLTYLSWAWAWAEVKKRFPSASYEIIKFDGLPYIFDDKTGYMVYTTVTIEGITHEMWLPVMDSNNRAMLDRPYEVKTKYNSITIQPATMFDINKTIMRCLTKNLAMFGLGLYIYAGEDLPQVTEEEVKIPQKKKNPEPQPEPQTTPEPPKYPNRKKLVDYCAEKGIDINAVCAKYKLNNSTTEERFEEVFRELVISGVMEG